MVNVAISDKKTSAGNLQQLPGKVKSTQIDVSIGNVTLKNIIELRYDWHSSNKVEAIIIFYIKHKLSAYILS